MIIKVKCNKDLQDIIIYLKSKNEILEPLSNIVDNLHFPDKTYPMFMGKVGIHWRYYFREEKETVDVKSFLRLKKLNRIIDEEKI